MKSSLKIGYARKKSDGKKREGNTWLDRTLFAFGVISLCAALVIPMIGKDLTNDWSGGKSDNAVSVMNEMSDNTEAATAIVEEEWSIFEYIGTVFADLLGRIK